MQLHFCESTGQHHVEGTGGKGQRFMDYLDKFLFSAPSILALKITEGLI